MYEEIEINGIKYPAKFGMNALKIFSEQTGKPISEIGNIELSDVLILGYIILIEGARVKKVDFKLSQEEFNDLLDEDRSALEKIMNVVSSQFDEKKPKGSNKTPKKAKR